MWHCYLQLRNLEKDSKLPRGFHFIQPANNAGTIVVVLSILVAPSFTTTPSNQTIIERNQVTFTCSATGNPVPNITWTKDGETVHTGETLSFVTDRTRAGEYWCLAENVVREAIQARVYLDVQCKYTEGFDKSFNHEHV